MSLASSLLRASQRARLYAASRCGSTSLSKRRRCASSTTMVPFGCPYPYRVKSHFIPARPLCRAKRGGIGIEAAHERSCNGTNPWSIAVQHIDRRQFMSLAAYGGAVFISGLPAVSGAQTAQDFYFVQLSDSHWGFEGPENPDSRGSLP